MKLLHTWLCILKKLRVSQFLVYVYTSCLVDYCLSFRRRLFCWIIYNLSSSILILSKVTEEDNDHIFKNFHKVCIEVSKISIIYVILPLSWNISVSYLSSGYDDVSVVYIDAHELLKNINIFRKNIITIF